MNAARDTTESPDSEGKGGRSPRPSTIAAVALLLGAGGLLVAESGFFARLLGGDGSPVMVAGEPERAPSPPQDDSTAIPAWASPELDCDGCGFPGTRCIDGRCRLAPGARWRVRPWAITHSASWHLGSRGALLELCVRVRGRDAWACTPQLPVDGVAADDGTRRLYFDDDAHTVEMTTEQLAGGDLEIEIRDYDWPEVSLTGVELKNVVASPKLFEGGLRIATNDERFPAVHLSLAPAELHADETPRRKP